MKDIKGFLNKKEAEKLQELFLNVHHLGCVLEIGTYCGKSALNFASVAKKVNGLVYWRQLMSIAAKYLFKTMYVAKRNTIP